MAARRDGERHVTCGSVHASAACATATPRVRSQELVNLLLIGRAHSNVFDGERVLGDERRGKRSFDPTPSRAGLGLPRRPRASPSNARVNNHAGDEVGGSADAMVLRGAHRRGDVGLLTLHEAYGYYEVGARLKAP